jgi:DNA-binding XRE family transcriptional regulator
LVDADEQATATDFTALRTERLGAPGYTPVALSGPAMRTHDRSTATSSLMPAVVIPQVCELVGRRCRTRAVPAAQLGLWTLKSYRRRQHGPRAASGSPLYFCSLIEYLRAMKLGEKIKKVRQAAGLNQKEVAERAGVNPGMLSKIENRGQNPILGDAAAYCERDRLQRGGPLAGRHAATTKGLAHHGDQEPGHEASQGRESGQVGCSRERATLRKDRGRGCIRSAGPAYRSYP